MAESMQDILFEAIHVLETGEVVGWDTDHRVRGIVRKVMSQSELLDIRATRSTPDFIPGVVIEMYGGLDD